MAGINFLGSYSGIDQTTIDKLMEAEKLPLVQLSNKKTSLTDQKNAWKDINTRLNSLFEKLKVLQSNETFTAKTSTSTNENTVSMTASKNAAAGSYKIHVDQLASSTSVISGEISLAEGDNTKPLGISGTFTIKNSDYTTEKPDENSALITIEEGDDLKTIASKINDSTKNTGISATIINSRLIISDEKTGDRAISLTDDGTGTLDKIGLDMGSFDNAPTIQQGTNSKFTVNGVEVERTTNTVSDVVEYVTINLGAEHAMGQYDTVKVSLDPSVLTKAVQDFVDQYNSTMSFISDKLYAGDPEVEDSAGTLSGDSGLMRLQASLRNLVTSELTNGNTGINDISQLGVTTIDKYGQLQFDSSELTKAIAEDPQSVMNFFISKDSNGKEVGFTPRLKTYVDSFISSDNGIIKGKTESFDRTLKNLNDQIDRFNARMEKKEEYYIKMYSALDVAMMQAESQTTWLQGQIDALNGSSSR